MALEHFRTSLSTKKDDPYSVLLRRNKLPMALLDDAANPNLRKVNRFSGGNTRYLARPFAATTHRRGGAIFRDIWTQGSAQET